MLVALIVSLAGWTVTVLAFLRVLTRQRREHGRREELLLARLCHLADRPWERSPADREWDDGNELALRDEEPVLISNPEQWSWA